MGERTKIEWCDHTMNPWLGCQEVSAGCDHCYARTMNARWHWVEGWGPHGERKRTSPANWSQPLKWARAAAAAKVRPRVFCASLADVFDNQVPAKWRSDLFDLIDETRELDWLLLTKRPQNIRKMSPWGYEMPSNIWLGTTIESMESIDRWQHLCESEARVRFISNEPTLSGLVMPLPLPDWVISGGETGSGWRDVPDDEFRRVRDECADVGVPFFLKQMPGRRDIPADLLVRQFPFQAS